jgi:carboxypeptidase T
VFGGAIYLRERVGVQINSLASSYSLRLGDKNVALPAHAEGKAQELDVDGDRFLDDSELSKIALQDDGCRGPHHHHTDDVQLSQEDISDRLLGFKASLAALPSPYAAGYHSFEEVEKEISEIAERHPDIVQKISLGKSPEGREIWALKISQNAQGDTSGKPGVVITGCHHAREWMTVEAPLKVIQDITNNLDDPAVQKRLDEAEVWVVPVVNPDGYEYSRTESSYWRKNRRPLGVDQNGKPTNAIGVDLNRNYWDGTPEHLYVYRPAGDAPGNTNDDYSATSDDPRDDTYRGPFGASEPEVKALLDFQLSRPNIKAVVDYHSHGDTILYPYGYTRNASPNEKLYKNIGQKMQAASSGFSLQQSVGLYPAAGTSDDTQDLNGILNFTIEMGRSFQPNPKQIPVITERVARATYAMIDEVIVHDTAGLLPKHSAS